MQLTRSRKIIGGLALAGTMALSGIVGFAQQGSAQGDQGGGKNRGSWGRGEHGGHKRGGMRGGGFGRFAENLNLTDAQKAQIDQIAARYRETAKAGRQGRQERGARGGFDPFNGGTFNES